MPGQPLSQNIQLFSSPSIHSYISLRTATRVPGRQSESCCLWYALKGAFEVRGRCLSGSSFPAVSSQSSLHILTSITYRKNFQNALERCLKCECFDKNGRAPAELQRQCLIQADHGSPLWAATEVVLLGQHHCYSTATRHASWLERYVGARAGPPILTFNTPLR